jgi:hypothetical protein
MADAPLPRLRQVAFVAADLEAVAAELQALLGMGAPFHDPGVKLFGLRNSVFSVGDTFVEVVSPVEEGTTAGRYLVKQGGDAGYMALFQVHDTAAMRDRAARLGLRVVWSADLEEISGTHFHPKDVPGAIVSVDTARPPETWMWGGPEWTRQVPAHHEGGIVGLTVACDAPEGAATTWASLLDVPAHGCTLSLQGGRQSVTFTAASTSHHGIVEMVVAVPGGGGEHEVCGVSVRLCDV